MATKKKATAKKPAILMSNKTYDRLKLLAVIILPAASMLLAGLANIWGLGFGEQIDQTIQLFVAVINFLLGVAIVKSSSDYKKGNA